MFFFRLAWHLALVLSLALVAHGCRRNKSTSDGLGETQPPSSTPQVKLLELPVAPDEVVVAKQVLPLAIQTPCNATILQGIGRYADVGWVAPQFFLASADANSPRYEFKQLDARRVRFTARFRTWRSTDDHRAASMANSGSGDNRSAFCDIPATLAQLRSDGINRLAMMPVTELQAQLEFAGRKLDLILDSQPSWTSEQGFLARADLTDKEAELLRSEITGIIGAQVVFQASTKSRRSDCFQRVELLGHDAVADQTLRDGETADVPLGKVKMAIFSAGRYTKTNVNVIGECAEQALSSPRSAADDTTMFSCRRSGDSISCTFEGHFAVENFVYGTHLIIKDE